MIDVLHDSWSALSQIPHVGLYLGLGWLLYLIGLGGWIVLQKREPAATMSWLLGLALLPLAGFLIYHVFGPQRIHRHRLRRARSRARLPEPDGEVAVPEVIELAKLAQAMTGLAPTTATDARLLVDGAAKYNALLADVRQARAHVHLEYYIYDCDRSGAALRDALIERARAWPWPSRPHPAAAGP